MEVEGGRLEEGCTRAGRAPEEDDTECCPKPEGTFV